MTETTTAPRRQTGLAFALLTLLPTLFLVTAAQPGADPEEPTGDPGRGRYLAVAFACVDCHTRRTPDGVRADPEAWLAGGVEFPGPWGTIYSANLTEVAPELGADDLEAIIRGEQHFLYPMPTGSFIEMAEQDMDDLIAYLQTVPLRVTDTPPNRLRADFVVPPASLPPFSTPRTAPTGASVGRGAYLVEQGGCGGCHTPEGADGQEGGARLLAGGGATFPGPDGTTLHPPNLPPRPRDGLGALDRRVNHPGGTGGCRARRAPIKPRHAVR